MIVWPKELRRSAANDIQLNHITKTRESVRIHTPRVFFFFFWVWHIPKVDQAVKRRILMQQLGFKLELHASRAFQVTTVTRYTTSWSNPYIVRFIIKRELDGSPVRQKGYTGAPTNILISSESAERVEGE